MLKDFSGDQRRRKTKSVQPLEEECTTTATSKYKPQGGVTTQMSYKDAKILLFLLTIVKIASCPEISFLILKIYCTQNTFINI